MAEETRTELQPMSGGKLVIPEDLLDVIDQDDEKGVSFKAEDQLLPLIYVLQSNSPACGKRTESYIEGAEPGHFWFRNALVPIVNGEIGFDAIPCKMIHTWIEWRPNRGGFAGRHDAEPSDCQDQMVRGDDGKERKIRVRKSNGNTVVETREFYLMVNGRPYVLPCAGTKHTFARQWQTMFHQFINPKTGKVMAAYARKYHLSTIPASNTSGDWFALKFEDLGFVPLAQYNQAKTFYEQVERGEKRAEAPIEGAEGGVQSGDIPF